MDYDTDRLDEAVLALLYLNIWEEDEWDAGDGAIGGARAWPASVARLRVIPQAPLAIRSIRRSVALASPTAVWSPPGSFWYL